MINMPSLHRNDALLLSRCTYLGLIVLLFPLTSARSITSLDASHFHPPLGPVALLESFPSPWVIVVIECTTCALLALWAAGFGKWLVGGLLSLSLMITSGLVYSTGKIDHDLVILLCPFLMTLRGSWPERSLLFCLTVYFASSGIAKITWLSLDTQASLSWALTYFHGYGKTAPLLTWSLQELPGWSWEVFDQLTLWFELCVPLALLRSFRIWIFLLIPLFHLATALLLGIDFSRLLLVYLPLGFLLCAHPRKVRSSIPPRVHIALITLCLLGLAFTFMQSWPFERTPRSLLAPDMPGLFLFPLLQALTVLALLICRRNRLPESAVNG